ncbi:hypothetical protein [Nocardioides litoris]|uniref:hypothetical protein n=1 Tax=Nocardioides litoris TaxID=1926648 RepID=UPI001120A5C9|nr:hypothetical protein [Nocardioides litoris]
MRVPQLGGRWLGLALASGSFLLVVGGGAAAAVESDTVGGFWNGMWWSLSLVMTEGFVGEAPRTTAGALVSAALMVTGFAMLSVVSASLASIFVRSDERPAEQRDAAADAALVRALDEVLERLERLEARLDTRPGDDRDRT